MRILLDTHAFLWFVWNHQNLSSKAQGIIADPLNQVYLSAASHWEIAIKTSTGKLTLTAPFKDLIEQLIEGGKLFAEFLANDKPLLVSYEGKWYAPIFQVYPETQWGGKFQTATNYRDTYVRDLIEKKGWMIFPPIPFHISTVNFRLTEPAPSPSPPLPCFMCVLCFLYRTSSIVEIARTMWIAEVCDNCSLIIKSR